MQSSILDRLTPPSGNTGHVAVFCNAKKRLDKPCPLVHSVQSMKTNDLHDSACPLLSPLVHFITFAVAFDRHAGNSGHRLSTRFASDGEAKSDFFLVVVAVSNITLAAPIIFSGLHEECRGRGAPAAHVEHVIIGYQEAIFIAEVHICPELRIV